MHIQIIGTYKKKVERVKTAFLVTLINRYAHLAFTNTVCRGRFQSCWAAHSRSSCCYRALANDRRVRCTNKKIILNINWIVDGDVIIKCLKQTAFAKNQKKIV